ncbi:MAG TPA: radical SAM protein, partial [bacterium]|nr:radical SAM protein [bacterium]
HGRLSWNVVTTRGCPYRCAFCHDIMGKGFRPHSAERVLADLRRLYERFGIREFHIVDDVFNLDRERMRLILRGVKGIGADIRIAFPNGIRGDLLNEEDIDLMRSAGVYNLTFSFETATPRLQEMIEKRLDIDWTMRMARYAHRRGIITKAYFMLGFPGETRDEMAATFALSRDPALDMVSYFKVAPFPHTRLARTCRELWGAEKGDGPIDYFTGRSRYEQETGIPLSGMIFRAYLRFYLPWRIVRLLFRLPRPFLFLSRLMQYAAFVLHIRRSSSPAPR